MPPTIPPPTAALLADLVRDLNDRLERHVLTGTPCTLHLVGADYDGDMAELHLQYPVDRSPRPFTPRMPPHVLLALLAGMSIALDIERGLGPSPATFDRLRSALEPPPLPAPPPAADTLAAFGFPPGSAGLSLIAEEIYALRQALREADPERWADLVNRTDHPANRAGRGATAALAAPSDASGGRSGSDVFLAGLGYPEGPEGERRMLAALRDLRAALAEQKHSTLGRTVWRAHWTEVEIPRPEDLGSAPHDPKP